MYLVIVSLWQLMATSNFIHKSFAKRPLVMGVLNVTPDSFSDGGQYFDVEKAVDRALRMIDEGADIIDIGGESTGPGSSDVHEEEELLRVMPVLKKLRQILQPKQNFLQEQGAHLQTKTAQLPKISVDTYKAAVAEIALREGADMINDVTALRGDPRMVEVLAQSDAPFVMMFSKDSSARTSKEAVGYDDVIQTIRDFFDERLDVVERAGISLERCFLDPGMGAFVSADPIYSLQILRRLSELKDFGLPLLVGASRKSFIGQTLNLGLDERLEGSLACVAIAVMNGANIIRAHDVLQTRRVVDMVSAILKA